MIQVASSGFTYLNEILLIQVKYSPGDPDRVWLPLPASPGLSAVPHWPDRDCESTLQSDCLIV